MSQHEEVQKASLEFYSALSRMANGDSAPMATVWSKTTEVVAQHPIGGRDCGYQPVVDSFARVAEIATGGTVMIKEQKIMVGGDMAVETGIEKGHVTLAGHTAQLDHRVTNVYRCEDGKWKIVHHHADPSPALLDVLAKLS